MSDNPQHLQQQDVNTGDLYSTLTDNDWENCSAMLAGQGPPQDRPQIPPVPDNYDAMRARQLADHRRVWDDAGNTPPRIPIAEYQRICLSQYDMAATGGRVESRAGTMRGRVATVLDNLGLPDAEQDAISRRFADLTRQVERGTFSRRDYMRIVIELGAIQSTFEHGLPVDAETLNQLRRQVRSIPELRPLRN